MADKEAVPKSVKHPVAATSQLKTQRVEAFSDGVFAVAITLLVLNILLPLQLTAALSNRDFLLTLLSIWPKLLSYAVSFVIIGIYWIAHHNSFHYIKHTDRVLLWLNLLELMCIVFIPFSTSLIGQFPYKKASIFFYGGTLILTGLSLQLLWWYATHNHRLVDAHIDAHLVKYASQRNLLAPLIYLCALGLCFINPGISLIIFILVPIYYILPGNLDIHWRPRQPDGTEHTEHEATSGSGGSSTKHPEMQSDVQKEKEYHMLKTPGQIFYQRQIAALTNLDIDALMDQYHADASLISTSFTAQGKAEIREHLQGYLNYIETFQLKSTDKFTETVDAILLEATIMSVHGEARVYDAFILRDGKITHQFTGIFPEQAES